jgi:hypothetical protein
MLQREAISRPGRSILLSRVIIGAALVCALPAVALLALQWSGHSDQRIAFDPAKITAGDGGGFTYALDVRPPFPWMVLPTDSSSRPFASRSTLTENGAVFGTAHSLASRIASEGGGLYVHWGPFIFFSTPDNSDPRTNGRTYGAILRFQTPAWLWLVALATGSAAFGILFPRLPGSSSAFQTARMLRREAMSRHGISVLLRIVVVGAAVACTLLVAAMLVLGWLGRSDERIAFDPAEVRAADGGGFIYALDVRPPFPGMVLPSDSLNRPIASRVTLTEDGAVFGTPHSLAARIASEGGGLYSHWGSDIYFSTPDNTDPRTNGRAYGATLRFRIPTWLWLVALATGGVAAGILFPGLHGSISARLGSRDVLPLCLLALVAFLQVFLLLAARGHPAILSNLDGGNICGWIAGRLHADRLSTDFLVGHPEDTAFYVSGLLVLARGLSSITNDIGLAYLLTYLPIVVFQLLGFYLLGLRIAGTRLSATVLALMTSVPIWTWGQNDLFGLFWLPLVRTAFDAVLPYFFLLFLSYGSRAALLPILFAVYGLTIYIHPVSAPAGAAGLWSACLALRPPNESARRRLSWLVVGGAAFVSMAAPFALTFFSSFSGGEVVAGQALSAPQMEGLGPFRTANGPIYYDAILALTTFVRETGTAVWPIWTLGLAGLLIVPTFEADKRRACHFLLLSLIGCLLASVGICFVDQTISRWLGRGPLQLDLIRGLRLTVVPLLAGFALLISWIQRQLAQRQALAWIRFVMPAAAVLLVAYWWGKFPNRISDQLGFSEIPTEYTRQDPDATRMLDHLRSQPVDGLVLPIGNSTVGLAVRYAAVQPVAFIGNDMNAVFYSGSPRRRQWAELFLLSRTMLDAQNADAPDAFTALVARAHAKYLVLENGALPAPVLDRVVTTSVLKKRFGRWSLFSVGK